MDAPVPEKTSPNGRVDWGDLNVEECRRAFEPETILDVLDKHLIEQMMRGFFHRFKKGIVLLLCQYDATTGQWEVPAEKEEFRVDAFTRKHDLAFFNKTCWEYRQKYGDGKCWQCDRRKAEKAVAEDLPKDVSGRTRIHECWLGFDDMTYPLMVGPKARGVLLTGQVVPEDESRLKVLGERIREHAQEIAEELVKHLGKEREQQREISVEYSSELQKNLTQFGALLQSLLTKLYEERKNAASNEIVQQIGDLLAGVDLSDSSLWWQNAGRILDPICALAGLSEIVVLSRWETILVQKIPMPPLHGEPLVIPAREVVASLDADKIADPNTSRSARDLMRKLRLREPNVLLYLSHTHADGNVLSTLMIPTGKVSPAYRKLVEAICKTFALRASIASLVFELRETRDQFRKTVAEVAHDFRTPLQVALLDIEELCLTVDPQADPGLTERLEQSALRVLGAREFALQLQRAVSERQNDINLGTMLGRVLKDLEPLARSHPCGLARLGAWPEGIVVLANGFRLERAFRNLIENAIKYSWHGTETTPNRYIVRVGLYPQRNETVLTRISNYGIGIPSDLLERMQGGSDEPGKRGNVPDSGYSRGGTGWGFRIAKKIIEECGGSLWITSEPADEDPRPPGQEYHRYVTTVEVDLPMTHERGKAQ